MATRKEKRIVEEFLKELKNPKDKQDAQRILRSSVRKPPQRSKGKKHR